MIVPQDVTVALVLVLRLVGTRLESSKSAKLLLGIPRGTHHLPTCLVEHLVWVHHTVLDTATLIPPLVALV